MRARSLRCASSTSSVFRHGPVHRCASAQSRTTATVTNFPREERHRRSTTPTPPWSSPSSMAHTSWTTRASLGRGLAYHRQLRCLHQPHRLPKGPGALAQQTDARPSCPASGRPHLPRLARRWQAKASDFYRATERQDQEHGRYSGTARSVWPTPLHPAAWRSTASPPSTATSCETTSSETPAGWSREVQNVTNGIRHRRWLAEINPGLDSSSARLTGGTDYLRTPGTALPSWTNSRVQAGPGPSGEIKHAKQAATFASSAKEGAGLYP